MIKLKNAKRLVRETTAPYEFVDDKGETQIEEIRVRYFSSTVGDLQVQTDWHKAKAEQEAPRIKEEAANAPSVKEQALQAKEKAQQGSSQTAGATSLPPASQFDSTTNADSTRKSRVSSANRWVK